ncbi:methyltransferase family protein [Chitinophaga ginsengisoli]|uniref:Methyltransferase family protein n=2 Tax=Chitinophaga ginsengisoli TaxID=363837 RepID=A0A2P8FPM9_9BACT|nr:methyltransferase family protein [Chitinophaga ginsengisoli]
MDRWAAGKIYLPCTAMRTEDAIQFIRHQELTLSGPSNWADLGCGSGTFTTALAHYLQAGSLIYAVDQKLAANLKIPVPAGIQVKTLELDFVKDEWPFAQLDGIVLGNALHYVKDQSAFMEKIERYLKPEGKLLIVEYNTDRPVPTWVPYPLSYHSLEKLFKTRGYNHIEMIAERSSVYGNANLYTAIIRK